MPTMPQVVGIVFYCPLPLNGFPDVPVPFPGEDPNLPSFLLIFQDELIGFLDASHATNLKTCRSMTGLVALFCFAAIAWKSCIQGVVATSSTEAEFHLSVTCGKIAKCLCCVLTALDTLRPGLTHLFIDNVASLHMINEKCPTPCAQHIDNQHFPI